MRPVTTNIICVPLVPFERFSVILPTTESHSLINLYIVDFLTTDDIAKLEEIKDSVLKPTKNREKRKERVKKYLKWVRTITANNQSRSNQFSETSNQMIFWRIFSKCS